MLLFVAKETQTCTHPRWIPAGSGFLWDRHFWILRRSQNLLCFLRLRNRRESVQRRAVWTVAFVSEASTAFQSVRTAGASVPSAFAVAFRLSSPRKPTFFHLDTYTFLHFLPAADFQRCFSVRKKATGRTDGCDCWRRIFPTPIFIGLRKAVSSWIHKFLSKFQGRLFSSFPILILHSCRCFEL